MHTGLKSVFLIFLAFFCLGMGGDVQEIVSTIPDPDRKFSARIVDQSDTSYEVQSLSVDGVTYLPASLGQAEVGVDFATIKTVDLYMQGDTALAVVHFEDGGKKRFSLDPRTVLFGRSKWGNLRLTCGEVKSITFLEKE
ncbi:MAG: hypothetical protein ACLFSY_00460 [Desulfonatronovibrionaceae bacterium]